MDFSLQLQSQGTFALDKFPAKPAIPRHSARQ